MIDYFVIGILGLAFVSERICSFLAQRGAAKERKELYDRIQAGTLGDYTANRDAGNGKTAVWREENELPAVEEMTYLRDEMPEAAFVEAQSGFNSLMGGA